MRPVSSAFQVHPDLHSISAFRGSRAAAPPKGKTCAASKATTTPTANRGVVILPGLGNNSNDYSAVAADLRTRGIPVEVANVTRLDWARNAAGLTDLNYWKGTLQPRPVVNWYLKRVDAAVGTLKAATDGAPITLLAHSAGGWLARVYMLGFGTLGIDRLVTLGSPHQPPPQEGGLVDQTRGILTWVSDNCPGAFHESVGYVTVAGKWLKGARLLDGSATWAQRLVGAGYQQVCGSAEVWGDGIIPLCAAHLEGAEQITLDGVYHSPLGSVAAPAGGDMPGQATGRPWYGSPHVLEAWLPHVLEDDLTGFQVEVGDMIPGATRT